MFTIKSSIYLKTILEKLKTSIFIAFFILFLREYVLKIDNDKEVIFLLKLLKKPK